MNRLAKLLKAYESGREARRGGLHLRQNPFVDGSNDLYEAWAEGWLSAREL